MSDANVIGTSPVAIAAYIEEAHGHFGLVRAQMENLVTQAFALTYEGPDAELVFNPGLLNLATQSITQVDQGMVEFALAISQVTSNISQSLGAEPVTFAYIPEDLVLPAPSGTQGSDYRIDVAGFETYLSSVLPEAERAMNASVVENQTAFYGIPQARDGVPGWSGASRDYAQNVVVPAQTENLQGIIGQVASQVATFMGDARTRAVGADQAGVGYAGGGGGGLVR